MSGLCGCVCLRVCVCVGWGDRIFEFWDLVFSPYFLLIVHFKALQRAGMLWEKKPPVHSRKKVPNTSSMYNLATTTPTTSYSTSSSVAQQQPQQTFSDHHTSSSSSSSPSQLPTVATAVESTAAAANIHDSTSSLSDHHHGGHGGDTNSTSSQYNNMIKSHNHGCDWAEAAVEMALLNKRAKQDILEQKQTDMAVSHSSLDKVGGGGKLV